MARGDTNKNSQNDDSTTSKYSLQKDDCHYGHQENSFSFYCCDLSMLNEEATVIESLDEIPLAAELTAWLSSQEHHSSSSPSEEEEDIPKVIFIEEERYLP